MNGVVLSQVHPTLVDELTLAIQAHGEGEAQAARASVLEAYRDTFEPFEEALRDHDPVAVLSIEVAFGQLAVELSDRDTPNDQVRARADSLLAELNTLVGAVLVAE